MRHLFLAILVCANVFVCLNSAVMARTAFPPTHNTSATAILTQPQGPGLATHVLSENKDIIVLDIPNLKEQGAMFNRIVALIERAGASRETVLNDTELNNYITSTGRTPVTFTFGNDLRSSEFARFFNLADRDGVPLNVEEKALLKFLLDKHWLNRKYGFLQVNAPDRVILSIPHEHVQNLADGRKIKINYAAREAIFRHELGHGEYYTNAHYADYCRQFWHGTMTDKERQIFRRFLGKRSYDTNNEELMINEMQAYLMHTPFGRAISPRTLGMSSRSIQQLKQKFIKGNPPTALPLIP